MALENEARVIISLLFGGTSSNPWVRKAERPSGTFARALRSWMATAIRREQTNN